MSTIKDAIWFSTLAGDMGIINITTEHGKNKTLIGISQGTGDEQRDIELIIDYGSKISLEIAQQIVDHLSPPKLISDNTCIVSNCQRQATKFSGLCRQHNGVFKPIKKHSKN